MILDELQKALDNRPYLENYPSIQSFLNHLDLWHNDLKRLFSAFQKDYDKLQMELAEYKETCRVLSDKRLMKAIEKSRKNSSKSSPYVPFYPGVEEK